MENSISKNSETNESFNVAKNSVVDLAQKLYKAGSEVHDSTKQAFDELTNEGDKVIKETISQCVSSSDKYLHEFKDYVEKNPFKSVLFGALAGIVINKTIKLFSN